MGSEFFPEVPSFCRLLAREHQTYCMNQAMLSLRQVYDYCRYANYGQPDSVCEERISHIDWHNIQRQILESTGTIRSDRSSLPTMPVEATINSENPYAQNFFIPQNN
ncbi:unnamed protein product, partial [Mesorhabditis belari]|uniref:Uncharacterized protein n=1 Tax=Mesorhabditis belari TaxID=2138241 RepID=A0AAF3FQ13_9BILA